MNETRRDILVIGSGIAGLFFAIKCSSFANVIIVTKGDTGESNTMYAQGGISAVFNPDDSIENHIHDTIIAGDGLCKPEAVRLIASKAQDCIYELEGYNVSFDKTKSDSFDLHLEGGHSFARVVHNSDATGREVENSLAKINLSSKNITFLKNHFVVDFITENNACRGAWVLNETTNEILPITADATMLATGGAGRIYSCNTNPMIATGDGFAIAYRAGVELADMEFVQFHPTALQSKKNGDSFLITEAIRGYGAELKHFDGASFMEKYHPMKSLAPRDIVSRAIVKELELRNTKCVYLDLRNFDQTEVEAHFPNIVAKCKDEGLDLKKDMIPVTPAAHFMCGGVATDLRGRTSMERLYCCGEAASTGVHGANRLASNSLLEGLVFANQASDDIRKYLDSGIKASENLNSPYLTRPRENNQDYISEKKYLQNIMWDKAGIIRNEIKLNECRDGIAKLKITVETRLREQGVSKGDMELLNMMQTSLLIVDCAINRKESRGCHYRDDYPEKSINAEHSTVKLDKRR